MAWDRRRRCVPEGYMIVCTSERGLYVGLNGAAGCLFARTWLGCVRFRAGYFDGQKRFSGGDVQLLLDVA